jgi:hypothetical protein
MLFSPKLLTQDRLDITGTPLSKISAQITGYSSGFRDVAKRFGITPFTPQVQINSKGLLTGIKQFQKETNLVGAEAIRVFSTIKPVVQDNIKIDWLN